MIPQPIVEKTVERFRYYLAESDGDDVAMTKALQEAFGSYCHCGEPLMLGVTHHKNAPCEVGK